MQAPSQSLRPISPPTSMSSRAVSVALAVVINLAIVYALVTGLASDALKLVVENIDVAVIKEPPPDENKPPPPPPQMKEPPPFVPPPDINIDITEAAPAATAITNVQTTAPTTAAPAPSMATPPRGSNQNKVGPNDYPPISKRLVEQGVTFVKVLVEADGSVGSVELVKTSGHERLDEATLRIVKARFHYSPAKDASGKPIAVTITQGVKWQIQ